MRKIITVLTIVLSIPAFGQNHFIGLKGGVSWTNVNSTNFTSNTENRTGFNYGLTYEYQVNKRVNVGVDLLYSPKGFTSDLVFTDEFGNPTGERATSKFNYEYLSWPLKVGFVSRDKFSSFANLGILPSVLVDANTIMPAIEGITEEATVNVTDRVTKFDLAGLIEIGAAYKVIPGFLLSATIGYQYSFLSITNDDYFSNSEILFFGMVFSVGLTYALKTE